ncbi:MAG: hypothetical protein WCY36_07375 [Candidatus Omnitrophota bacterium]
MMNKIFAIFFILLFSSGCHSIAQRFDNRIDYVSTLDKKQEITIETSYNEAFKASINVMRDLNISIICKDYEKRMVIGTRLPEDYGSDYGIYFDVLSPKLVKITIKTRGQWYDNAFISKKIEDEIALQGKLSLK